MWLWSIGKSVGSATGITAPWSLSSKPCSSSPHHDGVCHGSGSSFDLDRWFIREAVGSDAGVAVPWTLSSTLRIFQSRCNGVFHRAVVCSAEFSKSMFLCHGVGHVFGSWLRFSFSMSWSSRRRRYPKGVSGAAWADLRSWFIVDCRMWPHLGLSQAEEAMSVRKKLGGIVPRFFRRFVY